MKTFLLICVFATIFSSCKKSSENVKPSPTIVYAHKLQTEDMTWYVGSSGAFAYKFDQGHYSIYTNSTNYTYFASAPFGTINYPYSVQVDARINLEDITRSAAAGIVFNRIDVNDYSVIAISSVGTYYVYTYNNGTFTDIVKATFSPYIKTGSNAKNTITLNQNKSSIDVLINYIKVGTYSLSMPTGTYITVGPYIATYSDNYYTPVTGLFNNFIIAKQ